MTGNDSADAAVAFDNIVVEMGGETILDQVSFTAPRCGCTAVIGPNGAGKTTLLLALLGQQAHRGSISFAGGHKPRIGYVPQRLQFDLGLPMTVREFICLNWRRLPLWFGVGRKNRRRADALLETVGILHLAARRLGELSGGELRRALLALALGREPELLVLDEPTAGVDYRGEMAFYRLLDQLRWRQEFTQLMVCHNLSAVRKHATHVVCLNRRVLAEGSPDAVLTPEILTGAFMGRDAPYFQSSRQKACPQPETSHA